jgi:pimeloyl-ACP methyl ester carboxylesterase
MADFVLVHGAWHGAWCWRKVLPPLWSAGHRVFPVDLTGLGARQHLYRNDLVLADHVADVVATLEAEELQAAILVGHSYGGMVITGVADECPDRLAALAYVDAVVPRNGERWSSTHSAETQMQRRQQIKESGGIPAPDPAVFGLSGADRDWVLRRQSLQPGGCYDSVLDFDEQRWSGLRRHFIDCTDPALPTIAASRERARADPGWRVTTLQTGHDPMISAAEALVALLLGIASER